MAGLYYQAVLGILCLYLIHQLQAMALGGCKSCDYHRQDSDCRDIYKPKDETRACIVSDNDKTKKNLCKLYKRGWKIICQWGKTSVSCKGPCPNKTAKLSSNQLAVYLVLASTFLVQRLLH